MENKTAYPEWEDRIKREIEILFSEWGRELQLNLVAQGYEDILFNRLIVLFGSGFTAIKIIKNLREEISPLSSTKNITKTKK
ncbi:MAG: hypothetical protein PHS54_01330 [Clostridia bacterium]|nr:hypothetical protein [Clostridia bacterium]